MPDGERVSLDWLPKNYHSMPDDTPTIVLVGGITSDSRADYLNTFMKYAVDDHKFRIAIMNRRGTCKMGFKGQNPDPVSWDKYEDLDEVIKFVNKKYPKANMYLAGTSMGAAHIQRYAGMKGKAGESLPLKAMGCLSSPYCFKTASKRFNERNKYFKRAVLESFLRVFREQMECQNFLQAMKKKNIDPHVVLASNSDFDFTSQLDLNFRDYKSIEEYKDAISSIGYIRHIHIPTLSINSHSDILAPTESIPYTEIRDNPRFIQVVTNGGGHLEYFSGHNMRRWSYDLILTYFANIEKRSAML